MRTSSPGDARATDRQPWDSGRYLALAKVELSDGRLYVQFADGDEITIGLDRLRAAGLGTAAPRWPELTWDAGEIRIPGGDATSEAVPGHALRLLSDPAYAAHYANQAADYARRLGQRLKMLRRRRRVSRREIACRAGISPTTLSRVESGHHEITNETIAAILRALDATLDDLDRLAGGAA
jgi:DNA-binding XRE family transcriptional regulator